MHDASCPGKVDVGRVHGFCATALLQRSNLYEILAAVTNGNQKLLKAVYYDYPVAILNRIVREFVQ